MFKGIGAVFDGLTGLRGEDLLKDERVLFSSYRAWFSESVMIFVSVLLVVVSAGLFIYGWVAGLRCMEDAAYGLRFVFVFWFGFRCGLVCGSLFEALFFD